jgi:hypothetical protein
MGFRCRSAQVDPKLVAFRRGGMDVALFRTSTCGDLGDDRVVDTRPSIAYTGRSRRSPAHPPLSRIRIISCKPRLEKNVSRVGGLAVCVARIKRTSRLEKRFLAEGKGGREIPARRDTRFLSIALICEAKRQIFPLGAVAKTRARCVNELRLTRAIMSGMRSIIWSIER